MNLRDILVEEIPTVLAAVADGCDPDEIVGVGVHSDDDATGLVFVAHTNTDLQEQLEKYPEYPADAVWSVGDWDLGLPDEDTDADSDVTARANDAVAAVGRQFADDADQRRSTVWGAVVDAMEALHERGAFDQWPNAVRAFFVMDGVIDEHDVFAWHKRFNRADQLGALPAFLELDQAEG